MCNYMFLREISGISLTNLKLPKNTFMELKEFFQTAIVTCEYD